MPAGRPTKYSTEYAERARQYCLLGATDERLAEFFDVNIDTIHTWKKAHIEFSDAIKEGREGADIQVAASLYGRALSGDTTACIFWLKNRQKANWRDKTEQSLSNPDGSPLIPSEITVTLVKGK